MTYSRSSRSLANFTDLIFQHLLYCKRSDYLIAMNKIEQLEMEMKLKNEALEMKEAVWKSKVGSKINEQDFKRLLAIIT